MRLSRNLRVAVETRALQSKSFFSIEIRALQSKFAPFSHNLRASIDIRELQSKFVSFSRNLRASVGFCAFQSKFVRLGQMDARGAPSGICQRRQLGCLAGCLRQLAGHWPRSRHFPVQRESGKHLITPAGRAEPKSTDFGNRGVPAKGKFGNRAIVCYRLLSSARFNVCYRLLSSAIVCFYSSLFTARIRELGLSSVFTVPVLRRGFGNRAGSKSANFGN